MDWLVGFFDSAGIGFWYSLFKQTEMKQTAVEWFYNEIENLRVKSEIINMDGNDFILEKIKLLEQAKAMEKEQMLDFFCNGLLDVAEDDLSFDDYFNEKFKSEQ